MRGKIVLCKLVNFMIRHLYNQIARYAISGADRCTLIDENIANSFRTISAVCLNEFKDYPAFAMFTFHNYAQHFLDGHVFIPCFI